MRKVVLALMMLSLFAAGLEAHGGSIGIYTSDFADDCDLGILDFAPVDIYVVYFRSDAGPDGISGAEFRLEEQPAGVFLTPTWAPGSLYFGSLTGGMSIVFPGVCAGQGTATAHIGTLEVFAMGASPGWTLHIVPNPVVDPSNVWVIQCDENKTLTPVLGGWFHEGEGNCEIGRESATWGAIKSMFNE